jgi:hypothetical protein
MGVMSTALAERARVFAQTYIALVEALMREGVLEEQARIEARAAATTELLSEKEGLLLPSATPCPVCRK